MTQKHPTTGKKLRDMKTIFFFGSVEEAHEFAKELNQEIGKPDFAIVSSSWPTDEREWEGGRRERFLAGKIMVVAGMKKLATGFDDPGVENAVQALEMGSPGYCYQSGSRSGRANPDDKKMVKLVVTCIPRDSKGLVWGEVAGGLAILDETYEFPPTTKEEIELYKTGKLPPEEPPVVDGLQFFTTLRHLAFFEQKRRQERWHDGLEKKTDDMLTLEEMAKHIGVSSQILEKQVFGFLREAFDIREAQQQAISGHDIEVEEGSPIPLRGQRFPIKRMGYRQEGKESPFCLHKDTAPLCRYILFGHIASKGSEWLNRQQARIILDNIGDTAMGKICSQIQEAYVNRSPHQRILRLEIENKGEKREVSLPVEQVIFFHDKGAARIGFSPEAFVALRQMTDNVDQETAQHWWDKHRILPKLKSHEWYTDIEFAKELGIDSTNDRFQKLWSECKRRARSGDIKMGNHVIMGEEKGTFDDLRAKKFCLHRGEMEWVKWKLGMENAYDPEMDKAITRQIKL